MGLELVDFSDVVKASPPVAADGTAVVAFDPVDTGYLWRVGFMAVQSTSSVLLPTCQVYLDEALPKNQRSGTINGGMDTYDASWPLVVPATRALILKWTGADVGSLCQAAIQYALYHVVGSVRGPQPLY